MSTDPSIPPVPPESPASPAVVPPVEDKTVAIVAYLTFVGFIVALVLNNGSKKNALGQYPVPVVGEFIQKKLAGAFAA